MRVVVRRTNVLGMIVEYIYIKIINRINKYCILINKLYFYIHTNILDETERVKFVPIPSPLRSIKKQNVFKKRKNTKISLQFLHIH